MTGIAEETSSAENSHQYYKQQQTAACQAQVTSKSEMLTKHKH